MHLPDIGCEIVNCPRLSAAKEMHYINHHFVFLYWTPPCTSSCCQRSHLTCSRTDTEKWFVHFRVRNCCNRFLVQTWVCASWEVGGGEETKWSSRFWRQLCEFACRSQAYSHLENVWTKASCSISCIIFAVELVRFSTRGGLIVCLLVSLGVVLCNLSVYHIHLLFSPEILLIQINCSSTLSHFALHPFTCYSDFGTEHMYASCTCCCCQWAVSLLNIFAVKIIFWCHVVFDGLMSVIIFSNLVELNLFVYLRIFTGLRCVFGQFPAIGTRSLGLHRWWI